MTENLYLSEDLFIAQRQAINQYFLMVTQEKNVLDTILIILEFYSHQ